MPVSDPERGFWCEPCTGWPEATWWPPAAAGARGHLLLSWTGLGSCQTGMCGPKTGRALCSGAERRRGRGSPGRQVSSLLASVRSGFLPGGERFGRGTGWTDAPCLPNSASGEVPSLSRSVSSLALKICL